MLVAKRRRHPRRPSARGNSASSSARRTPRWSGPRSTASREMKKDGIRAVQLTYNLANLSGDGSIEPRNGGITNLGRDTDPPDRGRKAAARPRPRRRADDGRGRGLRETAADDQPHRRPRRLRSPAQLADAAIRAVADKGGVVGVYFMPYLAADMPPTGAMLLDHIDHIAKVAGEDHIVDRHRWRGASAGDQRRAIENARKDYEQRKAAGIAAPGEGPDVFTVVRDYNSDRQARAAGNGPDEARMDDRASREAARAAI